MNGRQDGAPGLPLALLAELTHRCPLQCPYCSNPLALEQASRELDTATWLRVIEEAAGLGALQIHFSGGEPTVRRTWSSWSPRPPRSVSTAT